MPVTPITTDLGGSSFVTAPAVTIKTATSLAGPWTLRSNLYLDQLRTSVAPAIGQAEMTFEYGTILNPEFPASGFVATSPLAVEGHYVWISIENVAASLSPPGDPIPDWYGIIEVSSITPRGIAVTAGITSGTQKLVAYDLTRIAERYMVVTATVEDSAAAATLTINKGLSFNSDDRGEFPSHGNRSAAKYPGSGTAPDAYVFSYKERDEAQWDAEQAVNYLLTHVAPKMFPDVTWYLIISSGNLAWNPRGGVATDRRTFKSLLDELISRHRGVGYRFVFDPIGLSIGVVVFSYSDTAIAMIDGTTFDANPNQFSLDFEQSFDIVSCNVSNKKISEFHKVVIEGAWRTTTCTMRVDATSNQLVADWSTADETAYAAAASGEPWYAAANREEKNRANKTSRSDDKLAAVFQRFRVSDDWNLKAFNPNDATVSSFVFPQLDLAVATGIKLPAATEVVWIAGLTILDKLTLRERYDYSGAHIPSEDWKTTATVSAETPFLHPFCFLKTELVTSPTVTTLIQGAAPGTNEVQQLRLNDRHTGGSFRIFFDGQSVNDITALIPFDATNSVIKSALEALSNIDLVTVTGGPLPGSPVSIEFGGVNAAQDVPSLLIHSKELIGGSYELLDKIDGDVADKPGKRKWSINTRTHQDRAAVSLDVVGGSQHFFAKTDFTSSPAVFDADDDPSKHYGLEWSDALVTLTFEWSERVRVEAIISTPAIGEQERVLRVLNPDCRLDYVVPQTVVGIVNGVLQTTDGGFVRDDRKRLLNFATAAGIWYGKTRQTLVLSFKQVRQIVHLGSLIVDIGPTYQKTGVNSVVTSITYDMLALTTAFETSYAELDVV